MIKSKIKEFARSRGFNLSEFERETHLPPVTVDRLWRGHVNLLTVAMLDRICEVLDCQPAELLIYERGKAAPTKRRATRSPFTLDY